MNLRVSTMSVVSVRLVRDVSSMLFATTTSTFHVFPFLVTVDVFARLTRPLRPMCQ